MPHPLMYNEGPEERRNRQEASYEEKLTAHLLTRYGLASFKSGLRRRAQRAYDDSRLKVGLFVEMFDYPVNLGVVKLPGTVRNCTVDKLYNKISTRKIIDHYFLARDESQSDKPFALVTPWTYIPKGMVIHERSIVIDELPSGLLKPCVRMIWTLPKRQQKRGKYLVIEPLDQFLAGINWEYVDQCQ